MPRFTLAACVLFAALAAPGPAAAGEADALREKSAAIKKEAAALLEQGRKEEAEKLFRLIEENMREAERIEAAERGAAEEKKTDKKRAAARDHGIDFEAAIGERERHLVGLEDKLRRSEEAGAPEEDVNRLREMAGQVRAELDKLRAARKEHAPKAHRGEPGREGRPGPVAHLRHAREAVRHLREASEHFAAADMPDAAHELRRRAEEMTADLDRAEERIRHELEHRHDDPRAGEVEELRREVD